MQRKFPTPDKPAANPTRRRKPTEQPQDEGDSRGIARVAPTCLGTPAMPWPEIRPALYTLRHSKIQRGGAVGTRMQDEA